MLRIKHLRINIPKHAIIRANIVCYRGMSGNEVQKHGFIWEKEIIRNILHVSDTELKKIKYTSKMDLPSALNKLDGCDVSIKTTGSPNTVCMGDCLRVYDSICSGKSLHLIVVTYKQDDVKNTKKVTEMIEVDITGLKDELFGGITREDIDELVKAVKNVPQKRRPTPEEHEAMYSIQKKLIDKKGEIYFNIKCDSKQSRLQCSFNGFREFIERNPDKVIARSNTNEFRGGFISLELESGRRKLKKKCAAIDTLESKSTNSQE
jgi:hypothetical protein